MKRVVDGLLYDTNDADAIHSSKYHSGDELGFPGQETLYKTPNGRYFLADNKSLFAPGSSRVTPKTEEQAVAWLQRVNAPLDAFTRIGVNVERA